MREHCHRNTKMSLLKEIYSTYEEKDVLNCYGDIFFVDEKNADFYVGRRILWNLKLSKEKYKITPFIDYDSDGYEYEADYDIKVIVE